jgi:hypothetical protein
MPDDLLNGERAASKLAAKRSFAESDDDDVEDGENEDLTFEVNTQSFAPSAAIVEESFTEDDESSMHEDLTESISEVERVYQDMGQRSQAMPAQEVEVESEADDVVVLGSQAPLAEATALHERMDEDDSDEEEDNEPYVPHSPFETEIDPITGVYRLKVKPATEEAAPNHEQSHGWQHQTTEEAEKENQPQEFNWQQEIQYNASEEQQASPDYQQQQIPFEENVETLSDEFGGNPEEQVAHVQDAQAEEFDQEHHNSNYNQQKHEEEQVPQPQETHNT